MNASSRCRTRPGKSNLVDRSGQGRDRGRQGTTSGLARCWRWSRSARIRVMPMTAPGRVSRCWRGGTFRMLPRSSSRSSATASVRRTPPSTPWARRSPSPKRSSWFRLVSERMISASESQDPVSEIEDQGPVNALSAGRWSRIWGPTSSVIDRLKLVDFKVRILNGGTEAVTRVLIDSTDGKGGLFSTVGVSANIVDASFKALEDAMLMCLIRSGTAPR